MTSAYTWNLLAVMSLVALLSGACAGKSVPRAIASMPAEASSGMDKTVQPGGAAAPIEHIQLGADLRIRVLGGDVVVVTHSFPWPANSLVVRMGKSDLVLVGTPYTPEATADVLTWLEIRWPRSRIVAVNTGFHVDNLGGNKALVERGIPVYGSDLTAQLLRQRGEQTRAMVLGMLGGAGQERFRSAHAEIPYVAPTYLYSVSDGLKLNRGGEDFLVYYPGPSQAPDKVVVYFPSKQVLLNPEYARANLERRVLA